VSANITTRFHGGVRYERVSRYVIQLRVSGENNVGTSCVSHDDVRDGIDGSQCSNREPSCLDPLLKAFLPSDLDPREERLSNRDSPWVPSYTSTPLSKIEHWTPRNSQLGDMAHRGREDSVHSPESSGNSLTGWSPNYDQFPLDLERVSAHVESDTGSPSKRKASSTSILTAEGVRPTSSEEPQQPALSADAKRRKLRQHDSVNFISEVAAATALPEDSDDESLPRRGTRRMRMEACLALASPIQLHLLISALVRLCILITLGEFSLREAIESTLSLQSRFLDPATSMQSLGLSRLVLQHWPGLVRSHKSRSNIITASLRSVRSKRPLRRPITLLPFLASTVLSVPRI
jgi:hypothetical protein